MIRRSVIRLKLTQNRTCDKIVNGNYVNFYYSWVIRVVQVEMHSKNKDRTLVESNFILGHSYSHNITIINLRRFSIQKISCTGVQVGLGVFPRRSLYHNTSWISINKWTRYYNTILLPLWEYLLRPINALHLTLRLLLVVYQLKYANSVLIRTSLIWDLMITCAILGR